jgi:hypothetical protein
VDCKLLSIGGGGGEMGARAALDTRWRVRSSDNEMGIRGDLYLRVIGLKERN